MSATQLVKAVFYPLSESRVLIPMLAFWLLMSLANAAGMFGIVLMLITVPAVFRYAMVILEARAKDASPATPDIGSFNWLGNIWSLFPLLVSALVAWSTISAGQTFGSGGTIVVLILASAIVPASFVVLAITHSPLHSLNPVALKNLLVRCGSTFWIASVYVVVAGWLCLVAELLPPTMTNLAQLFLWFSFFSVTGSLVSPYGLIDDVYIPDELRSGEDAVAGGTQRFRERALTHAYGFVSRGNRDGGFRHIFDSIEEDSDPAAAWTWYFARMLKWDDPNGALFFAQHYIHDLLRHGEEIAALKVVMRCRLINVQWKPASDDLPTLIDAAISCGNNELATVLKRL